MNQPTAILPALAPLPESPEIAATIDQFASLYEFPLDEFQRTSIATLLAGESVMVAAPTGSGKTVVAEFGIYNAFRGTGRVFYTAPIKALSNQKYRDLRQIYGSDVGLLTGDISENRDAQVVVMTTEILRNMLLQSPWELDDVDCIIFDEIHYLADPERGTTWEESIILCPEHIQLICLSATVTNAEEIAGWISRTHQPIRLVTHNLRPVPLALYYFHDDELSLVIDRTGRTVRDFNRVGGELRRIPGRPHGGRAGRNVNRPMDEPQPRQVVEALSSESLLPAIYFLFSRNDCQLYAEQLAMAGIDLVTAEQRAAIEAIIDTYMAILRPEDRTLDQVQLIVRLARKGIGFHHAGLLPVLKQVVEVLFGRGLMAVVFATDTLALGVNMPARTVVIGRMSKWDGRRRRPLIPNEFQQMAGRAGRRGMDICGHVVVPYSPWVPYREALEIATGPLHPVQSAFAIRYNTVLNLWDPPQGERVRQMLQRSLAQYQTSQRIRLVEQDILDIESELAGLTGDQQSELALQDGLYEEYMSLDRQLQALRNDLKSRENDLALLDAQIARGTPWTEPGRQALRKVLKSSPVGIVVHLRDHGWATIVGKGSGEGVAIAYVFASRAFIILPEYRAIDFMPDDVALGLPVHLVEPLDPSVDPAELVGDDAMDELDRQLAGFELPDLVAIAEAWREKERATTEKRRDELLTMRRELEAQVRHVHDLRAEHPFRDNATRKRHHASIRHRDALEKERDALSAILDREIDAEDTRIRTVIRGIRDVLHRFGYLHQGYPTHKADMLADIFDNDGLILCELVDRELLMPLSPGELAEVFSWFSFDRDFRYANHFTLPERLVAFRRDLDDLEHDILSEERDLKLFISEGHNPSFYGAALAWSNGATLGQIGEQLELSQGDLVLTFNKTIDLMRQVREMLIGVDPEHDLIANLRQAERQLRRGIVEQSLTLGFSPIADSEPELDAEDAEDEPEVEDEV